jgi:hypothetical protein
MPSPLLLAGVARVDITPDRPLDLSGVPSRRSAGVLDPLEAQVLVLRDEASGHTAVVVTLDTLYVPRDWGDPLRRQIAETVGIETDAAFESVMLAASHTHSAPGLQTLRCWGTADAQYREEVADKLVQCAAAAVRGLQPAGIRIGSTELHGVSCNRRTPGGPVDTAVTVASAPWSS